MANSIIYKLTNQTIQQSKVSDDLKYLFEYYWKVSWNVPKGEFYTQKILTEPKADIYTYDTQKIWNISEISKSIFEYRLEGNGSVFGIKLKPATQFLFKSFDFNLPSIDSDFDNSVKLVDHYLKKQKYKVTDEMKLVNNIINFVADNNFLYRTSEISLNFNTPIRKIQRLFKKYISLDLKWIISRYRILEGLESSKNKTIDWAELAVKLGFSDQSHFIREFKHNLKMTPSEYINIYNKK